MASPGNAENEPTSTEELRAYEQGVLNWCNASVVLKVVKKTLSSPKVGKRGEYRTLFVLLCNDDECRIRMIAFSPAAEKLYERIEENALALFTGLEVQEVWNKDEPVGPFNIEFKARAQSEATVLEHNYKVGRGMPFTSIQHIDFDKPYMRYKVNAELATDFTPFMKGLTGQAVLVDSTGRMPVHVNILEATPGTENMFRKGRKVDFKGTFRKTSTITRLSVETDGDVDFEGAPKKSLFAGSAEPKSLKSIITPRLSLVSDSRGSTSAVPSTSQPSSLAYGTKQALNSASCVRSAQMSLTGSFLEDVTVADGIAWGMLEVDEDIFYEVNIFELPPDAESLLIKGALVTLRGSVDGYYMTVKGWRNIDVDGHEMFGDEDDEDGEEALQASSALELRQAAELSVHKINARVLVVKQVDSQCLLTCMVSDNAKVAVKISVNASTDDLVTLPAGSMVTATGMLRFNGTFCEMNLEDSSALSLLPSADGTKQTTKPISNVRAFLGNAVVPAIKPEPAQDPSKFTSCNVRSGLADAKTLKLQKPALEASKPGQSFSEHVGQESLSLQCDLVDLTGEDVAFGSNVQNGTSKGRKTLTADGNRAVSSGNAGAVGPTSATSGSKPRRPAAKSANKKARVSPADKQGAIASTPPNTKRKSVSSLMDTLGDQPPPEQSKPLEAADSNVNQDSLFAAPTPKKARRPAPKGRLPLQPVGIAANPQRPKRESTKSTFMLPQSTVHIPNPYPNVPEAKHHFGDDSDDEQEEFVVKEGDSSNSADFLPAYHDASSSTGIADLEAVEDP